MKMCVGTTSFSIARKTFIRSAFSFGGYPLKVYFCPLNPESKRARIIEEGPGTATMFPYPLSRREATRLLPGSARIGSPASLMRPHVSPLRIFQESSSPTLETECSFKRTIGRDRAKSLFGSILSRYLLPVRSLSAIRPLRDAMISDSPSGKRPIVLCSSLKTFGRM